MSFKNIRFPTGISYGCIGGPGFDTDVITLDSGHEQRNQNWSEARSTFDVARACDTDAKRTELISFIRNVKGKTYSFRFQDPNDSRVISGEGVLASLGGGRYQLYKRYTSVSVSTGSPNPSPTDDRLIYLPVDAVIKQGLTTLTAGVHYALNELTGVITVVGSPSPAPDSWTGWFDIYARFDTDSLRLSKESLSVFRAQSIPIIEVRPEEEA